MAGTLRLSLRLFVYSLASLFLVTLSFTGAFLYISDHSERHWGSFKSDLYKAVLAADVSLVQSILSSPLFPSSDADVGKTVGPLGLFRSESPLYVATLGGRNDLVVPLLLAGADPNRPASCLGPYCFVSASYPLARASAFGNLPVVLSLLHGGASADGPGVQFGPHGILVRRPSLFAAATSGKKDVVEALLRGGADPNVEWMTVGPLGCVWKTSPLMEAVNKGFNGVVKELIKAGADKERGWGLGPFVFPVSKEKLKTLDEQSHIF